MPLNNHLSILFQMQPYAVVMPRLYNLLTVDGKVIVPKPKNHELFAFLWGIVFLQDK